MSHHPDVIVPGAVIDALELTRVSVNQLRVDLVRLGFRSSHYVCQSLQDTHDTINGMLQAIYSVTGDINRIVSLPSEPGADPTPEEETA